MIKNFYALTYTLELESIRARREKQQYLDQARKQGESEAVTAICWRSATVTPETPAPEVENPVTNETAEQRQQRRYEVCIKAGLPIQSDNTYARLPRGIGALARAEVISTTAFSKDVKLHIERIATG